MRSRRGATVGKEGGSRWGAVVTGALAAIPFSLQRPAECHGGLAAAAGGQAPAPPPDGDFRPRSHRFAPTARFPLRRPAIRRAQAAPAQTAAAPPRLLPAQTAPAQTAPAQPVTVPVHSGPASQTTGPMHSAPREPDSLVPESLPSPPASPVAKTAASTPASPGAKRVASLPTSSFPASSAASQPSATPQFDEGRGAVSPPDAPRQKRQATAGGGSGGPRWVISETYSAPSGMYEAPPARSAAVGFAGKAFGRSGVADFAFPAGRSAERAAQSAASCLTGAGLGPEPSENGRENSRENSREIGREIGRETALAESDSGCTASTTSTASAASETGELLPLREGVINYDWLAKSLPAVAAERRCCHLPKGGLRLRRIELPGSGGPGAAFAVAPVAAAGRAAGAMPPWFGRPAVAPGTNCWTDAALACELLAHVPGMEGAPLVPDSGCCASVFRAAGTDKKGSAASSLPSAVISERAFVETFIGDDGREFLWSTLAAHDRAESERKKAELCSHYRLVARLAQEAAANADAAASPKRRRV